MALHVSEVIEGNRLTVTASGTISREDYERFVPQTEEAIKRAGKIQVLFIMKDFHGWDAGALWEDIKFDIRHFHDIEKLAMVGDSKWEKWMASFCRPFTTAAIRYFDESEVESARAWLAA